MDSLVIICIACIILFNMLTAAIDNEIIFTLEVNEEEEITTVMQ